MKSFGRMRRNVNEKRVWVKLEFAVNELKARRAVFLFRMILQILSPLWLNESFHLSMIVLVYSFIFSLR